MLDVLAAKNVAMVTFSDYPVDFRVRREAEALVRAGMRVDLICIRKDKTEIPRERINGVDVLRLPINYGRSGKLDYIACYGGFLLAVAGILAFRTLRKRYSLVHVHNMPDFLVFCSLIPRLLGAKVILDLHDPMPELFSTIYGVGTDHRMVRLLRRIERWSLIYAHTAITPNIAFRDLFVSRGCPPEKMNIIMNSPDEQIFGRAVAPRPAKKRDALTKPFRVVHNGAIVERHGLDTAVRAIALARSSIPNLQFEIFGRGTPFLQRVLDLVAELNLQEVVSYRGEKSIEEIAQILSEIDLGLVPNPRNAFTDLNMPTRIFEYLALHKPVICPDTRGIRDYFNSSSMLFFEPGNPASLADKIIWACRHPEETEAIVAAGHKVYLEHVWEGEEKRLVNIVADLMRPRSIERSVRSGETAAGAQPHGGVFHHKTQSGERQRPSSA